MRNELFNVVHDVIKYATCVWTKYMLYIIFGSVFCQRLTASKKAHELIFDIWYSEQIFPPSRPDEIITLPDTKEKTEILTWPFATFQKLNV